MRENYFRINKRMLLCTTSCIFHSNETPNALNPALSSSSWYEKTGSGPNTYLPVEKTTTFPGKYAPPTAPPMTGMPLEMAKPCVETTARAKRRRERSLFILPVDYAARSNERAGEKHGEAFMQV
jgi:hypothetical protein